MQSMCTRLSFKKLKSVTQYVMLTRVVFIMAVRVILSNTYTSSSPPPSLSLLLSVSLCLSLQTLLSCPLCSTQSAVSSSPISTIPLHIFSLSLISMCFMQHNWFRELLIHVLHILAHARLKLVTCVPSITQPFQGSDNTPADFSSTVPPGNGKS